MYTKTPEIRRRIKKKKEEEEKKKKEEKEEEEERTQVKTMAYRVAFGAHKVCGAHNKGVPILDWAVTQLKLNPRLGCDPIEIKF